MKTKIFNFFLAIIFSVVFYISYIYFLNLYFEYANFPLYPASTGTLITSFIIAALPSLLYNGFKAISSFIAVFIYIFLYMPTIVCVAIALNIGFETKLLIQSVFLVSICMFLYADKVVLYKTSRSFKRFISFRTILIIMILFTLVPLYVYRSNLRFVSFDEVYTQRFANMDLGTDVFTSYLTSWLGSLIIPLCLLYGIISKKYIYFILGTASCVILYMATASKGTILMPFILLGLYYLFKRFGLNNIYPSLLIALSVFIGALLIFTSGTESPIFIVTSILIWRVVGTGGQLNFIYYDFFTSHPNIYYSHIGPVNAITKSYPYGDLAISRVIGQYYWTEDMNANANFWATDGIASFGLAGVLIVSVVFFFLLVLLNTITRNYNKMFLVLLFIPFLGTLLNTSLFQSMWSGGGFFIMLLLFFLKANDNKIYNQELSTA